MISDFNLGSQKRSLSYEIVPSDVVVFGSKEFAKQKFDLKTKHTLWTVQTLYNDSESCKVME